jgi:hypothetical protein
LEKRYVRRGAKFSGFGAALAAKATSSYIPRANSSSAIGSCGFGVLIPNARLQLSLLDDAVAARTSMLNGWHRHPAHSKLARHEGYQVVQILEFPYARIRLEIQAGGAKVIPLPSSKPTAIDLMIVNPMLVWMRVWGF